MPAARPTEALKNGETMMNDDAPDLLPCPFCGGVPYLANIAMTGCAYVVCTDCRMQSDDGSKDRVIAAWNTRSTPDLAAPRVRALVWEQVQICKYGPQVYEAETPFMLYQVFDDEDSSMGAVFVERAILRDHFGTKLAVSIARVGGFEEAKAAAQADFTARILAALDMGEAE